MLKVNKPTLLLVAGIVWLVAGVNILRIGINAMLDVIAKEVGWLLAVYLPGVAVIFLGFFFMFSRIVPKHQKRILGYPEAKKSIFYFFDLKGYLLMVFMMGLGIGLRRGGFLPIEFFAVFYNGLGTALSVAGIRFLRAWIGALHNN